MPWISPALSCKFGPYFREEAAEQLQVVTLTQAALGGVAGEALITKRAALERIAPIFGIENIDAALDALKAEQDEADQKAADKAAEQAKNDVAALHAAAGLNGGGKPGAPGQPARPKAPPAD